MNKFFNFITSVVSLTFIGLIATLAYWQFYPYKPMEIVSTNLLFSKLHRDNSLQYELNYCKNMDLAGTINRSFEDGIIFRVPVVESNVASGCHNIILAVPIPEALPSGVYILKVRLDYKVNPIRTVSVEYSTKEFTVEENELDEHVSDDKEKFDKLFDVNQTLLQELNKLKREVK